MANKTCWSLYSRKSPFHTNQPFFKQHHLWASGNNHVHTRMALIVYFRLESCLLADKISTNQNSGITVLLSFHFIALVYVPLENSYCMWLVLRLSREIACHILNWKYWKSWAASWQNQQNGMYPHRRLRSAWASAQSDQSLCCALRTQAFFMRTAKTLIRLDAQADLSLRLAHSHFVGFVMRRLMFWDKDHMYQWEICYHWKRLCYFESRNVWIILLLLL